MNGQIIWERRDLQNMTHAELVELTLSLQNQVTNQRRTDPVSGHVAHQAAHEPAYAWQRVLALRDRQPRLGFGGAPVARLLP